MLVNQLREALAMLVPDQQPRWHKGTANLVYTYIVVSTICGVMFFTFLLVIEGRDVSCIVEGAMSLLVFYYCIYSLLSPVSLLITLKTNL